MLPKDLIPLMLKLDGDNAKEHVNKTVNGSRSPAKVGSDIEAQVAAMRASIIGFESPFGGLLGFGSQAALSGQQFGLGGLR